MFNFFLENRNKFLEKTSFQCLTIFLLSLFFFLLFNIDREFIRMEPRWALFVRFMLKDGISFYPQTFHHFYPDYPGMFTILSYWLALLCRTVNTFTITFPTSVAASLVVVFVYLIGKIYSQKLGLASAIVLMGTIHFFECARTPSPDMFVTLVTVTSFYYTFLYCINRMRDEKLLWLIPLCLIVGFFSRGPIGLIIPASVACFTLLFSRKIDKFFIYGIISFFSLVVCEGLNAYVAYLEGGQMFVKSIFTAQIFGRLGAHEPFYSHILNSFGAYFISFPVALISLLIFGKKIIRTTSKEDVLYLFKFLIFWALIVYVGLSIPGDKKIRYVLSGVPPLAVIAAYFFTCPYNENKFYFLLRTVFNKIFTYIPAILLILLWIGFILIHFIKTNLHYPLLLPTFGFLGVCIICYPLMKLAIFRQNQIFILFIGVISIMLAYICFVQPLVEEAESARVFVKKVESLRIDKRPIVFYKLGPDSDELKYIVNIDSIFEPIFLDSINEITNYPPSYIIIARRNNMKEIHQSEVGSKIEILATGKIGHVHCVALKYKGK